MSAPTEAEIAEFARAWYRKLDVHAPVGDYAPMLDEAVELVFPEATVTGFAGFSGWYENVTHIFFDEAHQVKTVAATPRGDDADVKVVVHWEASLWKAPAATSDRVALDAYQTWVVRRSPRTGAIVIVRYVVDSFDYAPGSARL